MRKEYTSPVLNILCFAPVERLAALTPGELYERSVGYSGAAAQAASDEVDVTIPNNPDGNP